LKDFQLFCPACKEEKDVLEIERFTDGETVKLSCGHRQHKVEFTELIGVTDQAEWKHKRPDQKRPIEEGKERTKISGKTRRPTQETIRVDRIEKKLIHRVWEQNECEEWELVHEHEDPFPNKGTT
jgi:ribosomal protein L44E